MQPIASYVHDPDAVLDYSIDWSRWLDTDTIATSSWTVTTGVTLDSHSNTTTRATAWVSGGTAGEVYFLTNHVVTAGGREDDRSIRLTVAER
jgi:hypothetical protein